jgi:uncharacterized protein with HEPN domain
MLDNARKALGYAAGREREDLEADELFSLALVRLIEIVGEAAAHVSSEAQSRHGELPWAQIVAIRNRLIHGYDSIDYDVLWQTIQKDLPPLVTALERILSPSGAAGRG